MSCFYACILNYRHFRFFVDERRYLGKKSIWTFLQGGMTNDIFGRRRKATTTNVSTFIYIPLKPTVYCNILMDYLADLENQTVATIQN